MQSISSLPSPIVLDGINHWFGSGEARKQVIFDVNLEIEPGHLTILMGPSGSGKTTLLTLMGCLREVQQGNLMLLGEQLRDAPEDQKDHLRRQLGFIFQAHNLHESLTATQNVLMGLAVHSGSAQIEQQTKAAHHILSVLGLEERLDYLPANLSGGQKQRVAVARAVVSRPDIVFADEPTAALDKESGMAVVQMLKDMGKAFGTTTVMVTHDNRILELADRIITMEEGAIIRDER